MHTVLVSAREGQSLTHWGRPLLTSSEDKTAFFTAPVHPVLWCQHSLKEAMGLLFPLALGLCGKQNRMEMLIVHSSGLFTQGGEIGQPSYNLCMCDIPNLVAGPELALGRERLVEESGRSDGIRFQPRPRPQLWFALLREQRREGDLRGGPGSLCSSVSNEKAGLGNRLALGRGALHSYPNSYTPTRERPMPASCVSAPFGQGHTEAR